MATVRKREWTHKGEVKTAWVVTYTDQEGKRRLKTFDKKKDAEAFRVQVEGEMARGIHVADNSSVKVGEAIDEYLRDAERRWKRNDITGMTLRGKTTKMQLVKATIGAHLVSKLSSSVIETMMDRFREERAFKPNTLRGIQFECVTFLDFCIRKKWAKRNVLKDEPLSTPKKERRTKIPSMEDIAKLLEAAAIYRDGENLHSHVVQQVMVALGVFGGLRPGEVFALQWEDVDEVANVLRIRHSFNRVDGLKDTKTAAGKRLVPITAPIRQALDAAARFRALARMSAGPGHRGMTISAINLRTRTDWRKGVQPSSEQIAAAKRGHIVLSNQGKPLTPQAAFCTWHSLMKAAGLVEEKTGLGRFSPHALRHAAASLMIKSGMPALNLKTVIGHSSINITYDIYGHLFPEDDRTKTVLEEIATQFDATSTRQQPVLH
ncbi:tyrosine-type recombinase/integrase [Shinella zoogloeoides]|uniref:tyrosine-type recombinase/integrase n=1 Tax=Shinella zoogloeoides TaxID=352475 RepID=UPI001F59FA9D|nr:site-specific integrase [Shinella zoogloeoides]